MAHIDFVMGFILMMSAVFMIMYFVSNAISNNMNEIRATDMKESSISLESYLFKIRNDNSLIDTARMMEAVLSELNNTDHSESITLTISPEIDSPKVYDNFWNEIISDSQIVGGQTVISFSVHFNPSERKTVRVVYFGNKTDNAGYAANNVTMRILSDKELSIVSKASCSRLQGRSYDDVKSALDFGHSFRIELEGCAFGPQIPSASNIFIRNVPVLLESSNGTISARTARLLTW